MREETMRASQTMTATASAEEASMPSDAGAAGCGRGGSDEEHAARGFHLEPAPTPAQRAESPERLPRQGQREHLQPERLPRQGQREHLQPERLPREGQREHLQPERLPPCACALVSGFEGAARAARDPRAPAPARLSLVAPNAAMQAWLARWAEDTELVRRTFTIRRVLDGACVTAVATIASYGYGIDTSLAIESVSVPWSSPERRVFRSGVHSREAIDAALEEAAQAGTDSATNTTP
jgi:hypothetical protein